MVNIPAEGERAAICGYNAQYRISASLILRRLQERNLEWIRIADPKGGRLDDFQIGSDHRVDAYQIKWSEYPGNFTFNNLITGPEEKPSLILQLAEGWKELSKKYPDSRVIVHLITNKIPSATSKNMPAEDPAPAKNHFAGFIEQSWKPAKKISIDLDWEFTHEWRNTWKEIEEASRLSEEDFKIFVRSCELEFGYDLPRIDEPTTREQMTIKKDLENLTLALFDMVADPEYIIKLTRNKLLIRLGWGNRLEYRNPHEFPVDENLYQPIEETVEEISSAIKKFPGGYIAVLGSPGSGKSTTLTKTLRDSLERVVLYYAFVPDAQDPQTLRGESENFLHDIVLKLEEHGFREGEGICGFEREPLLKKFYGQIQKLHENWEVTGTKTIILIDGLDHIEREQHPGRSLLEDLPAPNQVPEGVYFILGSQTDLPFPSRVQASVRTRERRIEMQPLKRQSVFNILDKFERKYSSLQKGKIFYLCAGHPLSLVYLLNRLSEASKDEEIENILENTESYKGNIEEQYHSYWKQIEKDPELVDLLGLLTRIRGAIDLSWVKTWYDNRSVIHRLQQKMGHYFKRENSERWYFFHNSYRLFLNEKTAESYPGEFDSSKDIEFHSKLAEKCANSPEGSSYQWEQLYHLYLAGKYESVLKLASQEWFRNQFFLYRPVDAIKNDIKLALKSLEICNDPVALTRIELIDAELDQREFHLSEYTSKLISLLHDLDKSEIAAEYIRDGNRLRIDQTEALQLCIKLKSCGLFEEAKKVFELSEPLDLLYQRKPIDNNFQDENISLIKDWAKAAVHFQDISDVTRTILNLRFNADRFHQLDADTTTHLSQERILFNIGLELLNEERWEDLEILISVLDINISNGGAYWFWIHAHAWRNRIFAEDPEKGQYYLQKVLDKIDILNLDSEKIVFLADGVYRIQSDSEKTQRLLKKVSQPKVRTDLTSIKNIDPFIQRFTLNRILYALGSQKDPKEIVPDTEDSRHIGIVKFEQAVCSLARIWGDSWKNKDDKKMQLDSQILPLLHLFNNESYKTSEERISWFIVKDIRGEFYELLVQTVAQYGSEEIESLRLLFEKEWNNSETSNFWPSEIRRHVIMALWQVGINKSWAIEKLNEIELSMLDGKNIFECIEECQKQAKVFILLHEKEVANDLLNQTLRLSFGVGFRKDYQLNSWIEWLNSINSIEPDKTAERIEYFAQAISKLSEVADDGSMRSAAKELLAVTFRWSPRKAVSLFYWFFENEVIWYEDSIVVLLQESLNSDNPPTELVFHLVVDLLIPIATTAYENLIINLINVTATNHGNHKAVEIARDVNSKVNIYALPSTRPKWRRGIAKALIILGIELESADLTVKDLQADEKNDYSHDFLKMKDGTLLVKEQVMTMVSSVSAILELLNKESEDSYFKWEYVVENLIQNLDSKDVYLLAGAFENKYQSVHIFSILSRRLYSDALGAWKLGEKALNMSDSLGWTTRHDGGTRIAAFEALANADPTRARHLAYKTLIQDLVDPQYSQNIIFNLPEILPLITDRVPIKGIWDELESYVHILFESLKLNSKSLHLDRKYDLDTPSRALSYFIVSHINHNINVIAQSSKRICGELLLKENTDIQEAILEYIEKNESYQENILQLFDAVVVKERDAISPFKNKIIDLSRSPNYEIRRISQNLCKTLGFQVTPKIIFTSLPPIYQLDLSSVSTPISRPKIDDLTSETLPDPENLFEMILPYDMEIRGIAYEAFLPEINVLYRASQIIHELAPENYWSRVGEQNVRHIYESAHLRLTYKRPRALIARRSIFHIIAELIDTGWALGPVELSEIEILMRFYDPHMILSKTLSRPAYIAPIFGLEHRDTYESLEKWCNQIEDDAFDFDSEADDDIVILAENTKLKRLEWKSPREVRQSATCLSETPKLEQEHKERDEIFQSIFRGLVSGYPELQTENNDYSIVLRNNPTIYDSPGGEWLALNPKVGNSLGWSPSEEGFFRWVNDEGKIMAESVWWIDGNIDQAPRHFDDEVGEGWLVLASKEALNSIRSTFGPLNKKIRLERSFASDGQSIIMEKQYEKPL